MRYKIILIALAILGLTSCTKEKSIVGTWKVTYKTSSDFDREELNGEEIWTFYMKKNHHYTPCTFLDTKECTISVNGKITYHGCWYIDGDKLSVQSVKSVNPYTNEPTLVINNYYIVELKSREMSINVNGAIYEFKKI